MKPWHERDPDGRERQIAEVQAKYPNLHAGVRGDETRIRGTFPLRDGATEIDHFLVQIDLLADYPDELPVVREVGGRIPHVLDRHVIPSTGVACVLLPDQRWELWPKGASLLAFIDGVMQNYFVGQALVEQGEPWPAGEWAHGLEGKREYYEGLLGTHEWNAILKYLDLLRGKKVKGHWDCPCGSGRKLRSCHFGLVKDLRERLPRSEADSSLRQLVCQLKQFQTSTPAGTP